MAWWRDLHEWYTALQNQCPYYLMVAMTRATHRRDEPPADHRAERNGSLFRQVLIAITIQVAVGIITVAAGAVLAVRLLESEITHLQRAVVHEQMERKEGDRALDERLRFIERGQGQK